MTLRRRWQEAIYFGNAHWHGNTGVGTGPWAGADLEQGMYYGGGELTQKNNGSLPLTSDFVSLTLKVSESETLPHHAPCALRFWR